MLELGVDDYIRTKDNRIAIVNKIEPHIIVGFFDDDSEKSISMDDIKEIILGNSSLNIGDRVKLETVFYKENSKESPYDCLGTVTDFDGYWFYVDWDNGEFNTYRKLDADLIVV